MYPVVYQSIGFFTKKIRVSLFDANTITIAANPFEDGDKTTIISNISGEREQLRYIAKKILELLSEELPAQPTADDEAAIALKQIQEALGNEPVPMVKLNVA
jgi:hypothetical protein